MEPRNAIEQRAFEIRIMDDPDGNSPGVLHGVLMPYNEQAVDRREMFMPGSLYWDDDGIVLREQHNRAAPIVRFKPIDTETRARVEIALPDTQRGRDAAVSVRNGTLRGLSVEFRAEQEGRQGWVRVITRAKVIGAGLVDDPSYKGASVEVRESVPLGWPSRRRAYYL